MFRVTLSLALMVVAWNGAAEGSFTQQILPTLSDVGKPDPSAMECRCGSRLGKFFMSSGLLKIIFHHEWLFPSYTSH
jgi:hypothetical protein